MWLTHSLGRYNDNVNIVACHSPVEDFEIMLARHPSYDGARTKSDGPWEHRLPCFRNPDPVTQVALCVRLAAGSASRDQVTDGPAASSEHKEFHHSHGDTHQRLR
jgi:hypothetical protein